ncbi:MAG TPA: nitrite reductase small subunit NirD [Aeromicrobium sp.]|nr:nitrite reductase small subunit NirD [Aeromicrobium sp.]
MSAALTDQQATSADPDAWLPVCTLDRLWIDRGAAALVNDEQVAVFRLSGGEVCAVGHRDPFTGANVIARGLVGSRAGTPVVISPLHKQAFDLRTGVCLDDPEVGLGHWDVKVEDEVVWLRRSAA